ncbi:cellulose biosynthesis cyclic di-GMP-binding regulatory protein BcsB [Bacillus sp. 179-C3.3 HS]|uniref:cellulose biosynthesis cyclic di-GMP-binding regulatory protein BcsB n=1 Tax=Bacillus sp. 179-C3.3 HS TaxID=3232162 RepID=UPI0039A24D90
MKSIKWIMLMFALLLAVQPLFMAGEAMATSNQVQVKDEWIRSSNEKEETQHLSEEVVTLYGQEDEKEFSYQIEKGKVDSSILTLNIEASPLLISPSSFTIMIDGEMVQTIPVTGKNQKKSIQIKLNKSQLKKGFHQVQLTFYGVLKDGVCINQETPANWLKVYPESKLTFSGLQTEKLSLDSFPYPFVETGDQKQETNIVLPNEPNESEVEAAIKIYRTLKNKNQKADMRLLQEKEVQQISQPTIVVGAKDQWDGRIKSIMQTADIKIKRNHLTLSVRTIASKKKEQPMLFVTAEQPSIIAQKINLLTQPELSEQLTGTDVLVQKVTAPSSKPSHRIHLKDFGADNVTVGANKTTSNHYYYPRALIVHQKSGAKLNLVLKKSDTASKAERLTVMINDEPHDVPLTKLGNKDENGFYHVSIPVNSRVLQKNEYLDLQFVTSGFKNTDTCKNTDEGGWIFIDKSSSFQISEGTQNHSPDLAAWPQPFTTKAQQGETLIIMPDQIDGQIMKQMAMLSESFSQPETGQYRMVKTSNVTDEQLKNNALIWIGGIQAFPLLKEKAGELIVPTENGQYDVSSFGMINETTDRIVWTQPSVWNDEQTMTVFSGMKATDAHISKEVIRFLQTNTDTATIAIESKNGDMFSNYQAISNALSDQQKDKQQSNQESWIYFACMAVLIVFVAAMIVFVAAMIVYFARKKRKKTAS